MVHNIRVGVTDNIFKICILSRNDQIFQIDRAVKLIFLINHIDRGDIVVLSRLLDQFAHRLADRQVVVDHDEVGRHAATDLIIIV